jgi:hypothetical protein
MRNLEERLLYFYKESLTKGGCGKRLNMCSVKIK